MPCCRRRRGSAAEEDTLRAGPGLGKAGNLAKCSTPQTDEHWHTDPWSFESACWSAFRVMDLFLSSVARDQLPGHKRMIDNHLPKS